MADTVEKVDLLGFTFDALYLCGTRLETLRGKRFLTAVNEWYMPFVRAGWAVPLPFVLDVSTMLLQPGAAFKNRSQGNHPPEIKQLLMDYDRMLQSLRRQPMFTAVVDLLSGTSSETLRNQATKTFLRFLLAEMGQFRDTYAFNTRDLKLLSARPVPGRIENLAVEIAGKRQEGTFVFDDVARGKRKNEFGTLVDLTRVVTAYYSAHPLKELISDEEWLMVEIAARSPAGTSRVDYRFLQELLNPAETTGVEEVEPRPRMVEKILPTDSYAVDGPVGGYIDVNQRVFRGNVGEVLTSELVLFRYPSVMYDKFHNRGVLQFVRENIECIEEELRVLFCFVIDADPRMTRSPADVHAEFSAGMTPYVRARAVAARLIQDLARHLPRRQVRADLAVYLWSAKAKHIYRVEFDLFSAWSRQTAANRFQFAAGLVAQSPHLFYNRIGPEAAHENAALDTDPGQYVVRRSQSRLYHCRHLVFLTSSMTADYAFPERDPGLLVTDQSGDSIFVIYSDVNRLSLAISRPSTVSAASEGRRSLSFGQLSEDRLRARFLETVMWKGAGRLPPTVSSDTLSDLS